MIEWDPHRKWCLKHKIDCSEWDEDIEYQKSDFEFRISSRSKFAVKIKAMNIAADEMLTMHLEERAKLLIEEKRIAKLDKVKTLKAMEEAGRMDAAVRK